MPYFAELPKAQAVRDLILPEREGKRARIGAALTAQPSWAFV